MTLSEFIAVNVSLHTTNVSVNGTDFVLVTDQTYVSIALTVDLSMSIHVSVSVKVTKCLFL